MGAKDMQQAMLDAMQLLGQKAANSTNAAITIKGEVVELIDSGNRQYAISHGGTIYKDVYAIADASYPISTIVYILIPDGNFDNPKYILNTVTPDVTTYVPESEEDIYIPISSNLFGAEESVDLQSWENKKYPIIDLNKNDFKTVFSDYLTTNRTFLFTALIKTEIDADHQSKGNYGLQLNLPFTQIDEYGQIKSTIKTFFMDVDGIQGNPYAFNEYQRVNLYFTIDDTLTYDKSGSPVIIPFTQDFGYTQPRTDISSDIHIRDIAIKMIDTLTEADSTGYYLTVIPSEGNYFTDSIYVNKKILTPLLKVNGKTTDISTWECYWFVEDASIDTTKEGYSTFGGLGWKCLNKKINVTYDNDGHKTFQYVTTNRTLEVKPTDVISTLRYKCVLIKDEKIVGGSVCLKNLGNTDISISLVSATGSNEFVEDIGNVRLIARIKIILNRNESISTAWQRFDKNGNYIQEEQPFYTIVRYNEKVGDYYETEILYPCSMLEKLNTVKCTFYRTITNNGTIVENNLGTASIIVITQKNLTYGLTIDGVDVLYKYDADGDSPMVANYDGPLSSRVTTIEPFTFRIFKPDGSELTDIEYRYVHYKWSLPKNSMMQFKGITFSSQDDDYYYLEGYDNKTGINYTISPTYNKKKSNNSIFLTVDFDNITISEVKNPKFLKDGEGGTNGSKYAAILTYNSYGYGERDSSGNIRKLHLVWVNSASGTNKWKIYDNINRTLVDFNSPRIGVDVYKDGEKITSGYSVSWSIFDSQATDPCFNINNGVLSIKSQWTNANSIFCNIVQCEIKVGEVNNTGDLTGYQEVIYAYYPIEITRIQKLIGIVPSLDGGFEEVVYVSDGTNPQYDNTNDFYCTDDLYNNDEGDYYDYTWSASSNLKVPSTVGTKPSAKIKPKEAMFNNGDSKNYVKVSLDRSAEKTTALRNKITEVNNNLTLANNKITFYTSSKTNVLDFQENFVYNNYIEKLNQAKTILNYRFQLLDYINKLYSAIEDINSYCIASNIQISDFRYTYYYSDGKSALAGAHTVLYLLGYNYNLSDISDLISVAIPYNLNDITNIYGAIIANQLNNLVSIWNTLLTQYQSIYIKLVEQNANGYIYQDEYNNLASFDSNVYNLVNNNSLNNLVNMTAPSASEQYIVDSFIKLKNELQSLFNKIADETSSLVSYSAFVDDLLIPIRDRMAIYNNLDYQNEYYNNLINSLTTERNQIQTQLTEYQGLLNQDPNIIHIKPIVMIYNRYEFANINGWDGNKLYTDQNNSQYMLAPQVGAGKKTNGTFTGIIMGIRNLNASDKDPKIGLFGFSSGTQSLFLNAGDGSAIFGKSGTGQITIDPSQNKALLYSSNYWKNYGTDGKPVNYNDSNKNNQGTLIDLSTGYIHFANASGKIYSGSHTTLGSIADGFYLSHDGLSIGQYFNVIATGDNKGQATITQDGTNLGAWEVNTLNNKKVLKSTNGGIYLDAPSSQIRLGSDIGEIYSGSHNTIGSTANGFYLSNKGLSIGKNFVLDATGQAQEGSTFGNWKIKVEKNSAGIEISRGLVSSNGSGIYMDSTNSKIILGSSTGSIYSGSHTNLLSKNSGFYIANDGLSIGSDFIILSTGEATINKKGSSLGQWKINENNQLYSNSNGILLDAPNSRIILGSGSGEIYSGSHTTLDSDAKGFFINYSGLSIHSRFYVDASTGTIRVGRGAVKNTGKHWTIDGSGSNESYIGYNADAFNCSYNDGQWTIGGNRNSTYIGTDGFRLGTVFAVDDMGHSYLKGEIQADSGKIGGWTIKNNSLIGVDGTSPSGIPGYEDLKFTGHIVINGAGDIKVESDNPLSIAAWKLNRNGTINVDYPLSNFGGVIIEPIYNESKELTGKATTYHSEKTTDAKSANNGVFQGEAYNEILQIAEWVHDGKPSS